MESIDRDVSNNDFAALEMALNGPATSGAEPAMSSGEPGFLDIEIPVAVSFGRARVALKDAMRLASGSVVRLDRTVSDPVDIVVNGTPVARGEILESNGSFAVRVTEVLKRPTSWSRPREQA